MATDFERDLAKTQIAYDSKGVTGFLNIDEASFSYVYATRTFSVSPVGTSYRWYENYTEHNSTGQDIVIENTSGVHFIYLRSGNLHELVNPTVVEIDSIIRTYLPVAYVYMTGAVDAVDAVEYSEGPPEIEAVDAVDEVIGTVIFTGDARHSLQMDGSTHSLIHWRDGLAYLSGLALGDISADGDGSLDAMCQVGVASGGTISEDNLLAVDAIESTTGIPIFHRTYTELDGTIWNRTEVENFAVRPFDVTPEAAASRLAYNDKAETWTLKECDESTVTAWTLYATTDAEQPIICIMGIDMYATIELARAGAITQIYDVMENATLSRELRPIGTFYCSSDTSYTNTVDAIIISTVASGDYDDWRHQNVSRTQRGLI